MFFSPPGFLTELHTNLDKRIRSTGENSQNPLEKIQKICRFESFLSLVMVERVLNFESIESCQPVERRKKPKTREAMQGPILKPFHRFLVESPMLTLEWLIAWIPLPCWFPWNFRNFVEFGRVRGKLGKFGKIQGNSVEFSGVLYDASWGIILKPQPPHSRQEYEQTFGCKAVEFALFWSVVGHILSRFLFIFLPCMWGAGVTRAFLSYVRIQWEFLADFGATVGFPAKSRIGVVSGDSGSQLDSQEAFAWIATLKRGA